MNEKQIFSQKKHGDIRLVAEIIGESHPNTDKILRRADSKKHKKAVDALAKVIETRKQLLSQVTE